jgi:hypothetical protein
MLGIVILSIVMLNGVKQSVVALLKSTLLTFFPFLPFSAFHQKRRLTFLGSNKNAQNAATNGWK